MQEWEAEPFSDVIRGDQRKGAKAPKDKSVRDARQRTFANDFALQQDFRDEYSYAFRYGGETEIGVRAAFANAVNNSEKACKK